MSFSENVDQVLTRLARVKIVPVLALDSVDDARKIAAILSTHGLLAAEITFRTAAAEDAIRVVSEEFPELCLGAGTVLNETDLQRAIGAGATFAVAPGFNPQVVNAAIERAFPFFPGIATPTDVEQAMALGCRMMKFFPAEAAGGTKMLTSILAPYKHLGVRFMPTGGLSPANVQDYLAIPEVVAIGGTWVGKSTDMAKGAWDEIDAAVKAAVLETT